MKCPKCGYLGFEAVDRCRNCGYDFSLHAVLSAPELPMREEATEAPLGATDFSLPWSGKAAEAPASAGFTPELQRALGAQPPQETSADLPLFGAADDAPLISGNRPPRPPLAVRRATPEIPRLRTAEPRAPLLDLTPPDSVPGQASAFSRTQPERLIQQYAADTGDALVADAQPASVPARVLAALIDVVILSIIDASVVYFTLQICGLALNEAALLPKVPLVAFLLVQNGGYLVAFTAGGQTLGKMAAGIRVVPVESHASVGIEQSLVRTIAWTILAAPAGLGFVTALVGGDRRGLHDRLARTKVVRASA